jgi:hypothetical protein
MTPKEFQRIQDELLIALVDGYHQGGYQSPVVRERRGFLEESVAARAGLATHDGVAAATMQLAERGYIVRDDSLVAEADICYVRPTSAGIDHAAYLTAPWWRKVILKGDHRTVIIAAVTSLVTTVVALLVTGIFGLVTGLI